MFDVLIAGGDVYDGTGGEPLRADVGVVGDRVADVGPNLAPAAASVIDATGKAVCPGSSATRTSASCTTPGICSHTSSHPPHSRKPASLLGASPPGPPDSLACPWSRGDLKQSAVRLMNR
jgi:hypothetical protein